LFYNMHTNETDSTKIIANELSIEGYKCFKLQGYFKHPLGSEPEKFVKVMNEVKEKGKTYDLLVDIHGQIFFPSLRHKQLFEPNYQSINTSFSCLFIVYCRGLFNWIKKDLDHLWDNERFFKRLLRRNWTHVVFDSKGSSIISKLGLERKYIEFEVANVEASIIVLKKWLETINEDDHKFTQGVRISH
jgi:hypothetical protein